MEALAIGEVAREGVLRRDGDGLQLEVEIAPVDALRPVAQERAERAGKERSQLGIAEGRQRADRLHSRGP